MLEKNKSLMLIFGLVAGLLCLYRTLVVSRKRKLRELYAVAQSAAPIPTLPGLAGDAPPLDHGESAFLDLNDILQCVCPRRQWQFCHYLMFWSTPLGGFR